MSKKTAKRGKKVLLVLLLIPVIVVALFGAFYLYADNKKDIRA